MNRVTLSMYEVVNANDGFMVGLRDFEWIDQHYAELQQRYPNMYIAVKDGEVLSANREYGKMYDEALKKSVDFVTDYIFSGEPFVFKAYV